MKIGFFWHSLSTGNLGVGALSVANLILVDQIMKKLSHDAEYVIFGPKGYALSTPIEGVPKSRNISLSVDKLHPARLNELISEINSCDLILDIGSGDSFSDIYGLKRFSKILLSKFLVKNSSKKLILSPQTIGPFKNPIYRKLAAYAMSKAAHVYARDEKSLAYVREIEDDKINAKLATDVAMLLPVREAYKTGLVGEYENVVKVGINVSGLLYSGGYTGRNQFNLKSSYQEMIFQLVNAFSVEPDVQLWLVPHVLASSNMKEEDDYYACQMVAERFPGAKLAPRFQDPIEAKTFIAGLDFFVGSRMHATIAAFSTGVPVIPLAYSRKFSGLFGSLNYNRVIDLTECDSESVVEITINSYRSREDIAREVAQAYKTAEERIKVYTNDLEIHISSILNQTATTPSST